MILTWWQVLVPAVVIAAGVRWHATRVADWYFGWVDLFDQLTYEPSGRPPMMLWRAFLGRMSTPFAIGLALGIIGPGVYTLAGFATVGAVGGLLVLWPMVFHGVPQKLKLTDWLIYVIYGSFILSTAGATALGAIAGETIRDPAELAQQLALIFAVMLLTSAGAFVYDRAARTLGKQLERRPGGIDYPDYSP